MRKNILFKLCALCLALMLLSGCGASPLPNDPPSSGTASEPTEPPSGLEIAIAEFLSGYQGTQESEAERALLDSTAEISAEGLAAMEQAVSEIIIAYPYSEIMGIESAYARYLSLPEYSGGAGTLTDSLPLDPETLYEHLKANNAAYNKDAVIAAAELEDDYALWACEVICDTLNRELPELEKSGKLGELEQILGDLKLFKNGAGLSNAYVTDDNCMHLSPTMLENMNIITDSEYAAHMTIAHETEHVLQKRSASATKALGVERGYGFCVTWAGDEINAMYYNWFIEAAVEKLAVRLYDSTPRTYKTLIGYMDSLSLLSFLLGGGAYDVPRLTEQTSLDEVFDAFALETEEEKLDLLYYLYAVELIQDYAEGFPAAYEDFFGTELTAEAQSRIRRLELKNPVGQMLGKYFYRNLARYVAENAVTVREVFELITIFEFDFNYHLDYTTPERCEGLSDALEDYVALQELFFSELAGAMGEDEDELHRLYTAHNCRQHATPVYFLSSTDWDGVQIFSMDGDIIAFLNVFYERLYEYSNIPVREVWRLYSGA